MDPTGDLDRMVRDFKADNAERQKKLDEWRAFSTMMSEEIKAYGVKKVAEEIKEASDRMRKMDELRKIKNDKFPQHIIDMVKRDSCNIRFEDVFDTDFKARLNHHARDLYTDGWRCGGGIDQSGRRILFRGEGTAYVSLDVWCEVERLTKAKWDELHGRNYGYGSGSGFEPKDRQFIPYLWPKKDTDVTKERTQVTEVNEMPETIDLEKYRQEWEDTLKTFSKPTSESIDEAFKRLGVEVLPARFPDEQLTASMAKADRWLKRHKTSFLPSVNPLGDTAMYTRMMYHSDIFGYRFGYMKFKKGGSRG